ncbi:MAG: acyltransferase [Xanthomonadales bacterium]|jgi:1-acyl-sn-glycerol-3-phosphate acyltransferase|nr:acyltransferase [Xanthomonadales bacterium]
MRIVEILRLLLAAPLLALNVTVHALPILALALLKLIPVAAWRARVSALLVALGENWIAVNNRLLDDLTRTRVEVEYTGLALQKSGWYLVIANHQSWVDIPILQRVLLHRIPFLKFFLKQQLIWVPLLGLVWWAMDFPFMRRYSRTEIARRPELKGRDLDATRKACARFRQIPVSVMNFIEGTRYTAAKHAAGDPALQHLLPPRAGGVAYVMQAMGDAIETLVDVTIHYPSGIPTMVDLLCGRVRQVRVRIHASPIPAELRSGDYEDDAEYRARFQSWVNGLWRAKDIDLRGMRQRAAA